MSFADGRGNVPGARELEEKLQIKPGQSVAVVNAPPESRLRLLRTAGSNPDQADVVIGFAVRPADLAWLRSVYAAARAGRLAWVIYPSPGQPGIDLRRDWLVRALRQYGVEAVQDVSINRTWSALQLHPPEDDHQPDSSTAKQGQQASHEDNDQTSQEGTDDTTSRFRVDFLGELDASAAGAAEARLGKVEGLLSGSALLVVKRGSAAGSRFLLDQPVTSAGRHPNSDIYLDDVTVSRRHAEFRRENGEFQIVDTGSLNGTYVNRKLVASAVLANGDEIQIGKFRLVFLTGPTTG
jgi:pSer/pThr/pTyr-binding forkhead associated (FHA) protein